MSIPVSRSNIHRPTLSWLKLFSYSFILGALFLLLAMLLMDMGWLFIYLFTLGWLAFAAPFGAWAWVRLFAKEKIATIDLYPPIQQYPPEE